MIYVVIALVMGLIGSLVGRPKGYPVWGFFMGLVLSLIGVIIVALWSPKNPSDPYWSSHREAR